MLSIWYIQPLDKPVNERWVCLFSAWLGFAHTASETLHKFDPQDDLESQVSSLALDTVVIASVSLLILVIIATVVKDRLPRLKMPLFILMVISMAGSVMVLLGSTIYLNTQSDSGGPIHWHADFEFWACDNQLELRDPSGVLTNKIGTAVLHEHDDQRIHLEGVVVDKEIDASLGKFLYVVGGEIDANTLKVPLNDDPSLWFEDELDGDGETATNSALIAEYIYDRGHDGFVAEFSDGLTCGSTQAEVQTFVYHYEEDLDVYWQEKIAAPESYAINEDPNVPPGDCVIFEFSKSKERTDKLCAQFGIRDIDKCEAFGVEPDQRGICTVREVGIVTEVGEIIELSDLLPAEPAQLETIDSGGDGA